MLSDLYDLIEEEYKELRCGGAQSLYSPAPAGGAAWSELNMQGADSQFSMDTQI